MRDLIDYRYITESQEAYTSLKELFNSKEIALDTETAYPKDKVKQSGFRNRYNLLKNGDYAPFDCFTSDVRLIQMKGENTVPFLFDMYYVDSKILEKFFSKYTGTFILHNAKFDMKMIKSNVGTWIDNKAKIYDTMQASMLHMNATGFRERGNSLLGITRDFLNIKLDKTEQNSDWSKLNLSKEQLNYAALDVMHLHSLKQKFINISQEMGLTEVMNIEMNCVGPVARIEYNGIPMSLPLFNKLQEAVTFALPALLSKIGQYFKDSVGQTLSTVYLPVKQDGKERLVPFQLPWASGKAGKDFLMSRANLVKEMLLKLGLKDSDGNLLDTTEKSTLILYKDKHPGIETLINYWNLVKQSQFDYDTWVHPLTKRIHSSYQAGAASTGRFSCVRPNQQQTPSKMSIRHPDGTELNYRVIFESDPGYLMCSADFSGQELSIMAASSGDPIMIKTLNEGGDIHGEAASGMFNIPLDQVRNKIPNDNSGASYRDRGKSVVFSLAYGKSETGFSVDWACSKEEAKKYVDGFAKKFPTLVAWLNKAGELGVKTGYSRLSNGAIRFVGIAKRDDKDAPKRAAMNNQIQGLASWQTRMALIKLDTTIKENNYPIYITGVIHDEILSVFKYSPNCFSGRLMEQGVEGGDLLAAKEKCLSSCNEEHCASKYEAVIGNAMRWAGEEVLKGVVPAAFSVGTCKHWKH